MQPARFARAEQHALAWLAPATLTLMTGELLRALGPRDSDTYWVLVRYLLTLADLVVLGALVSYAHAHPRPLARASLIAILAVAGAGILYPFLGAASADLDTLVAAGKQLRSGTLVAIALALWSVARAMPKPIGPSIIAASATLAALGLTALTLVDQPGVTFEFNQPGVTFEPDHSVEAALDIVLGLAAGSLFVWRHRTLARAPSQARDAEPHTAWITPLAGARLIRTALIGSVAVIVSVLVLGFVGRLGGGAALGLIVALLGGLAAIVLAVMNLNGLAKVRRVPPESLAGGPLTAAFIFACAAAFAAVGLIVVTVLAFAARAGHTAQLTDAATEFKLAIVQLTAGSSIALFAGIARLGKSVGERELATRGRLTCIIHVLMMAMNFVLSDRSLADALGLHPSSTVTEILPIVATILVTMLALATLGELLRTIQRRLDQALAATWQ